MVWQALPRALDRRSAYDFSGGINTGNNPLDLKDNEETDGYGWDFDHYPSLSTRKGRTAYGASGGGVTYLLMNFNNTHLVRAVGTKLQYNSTGTTWSDISGTWAATDWCAANFDVNGPALILTNGTDAVQYWNGTTLSVLSSSAPKGKYVAADNRRVYIASGDTVSYCAFQNATDWTTVDNAGVVQYYTANGGDITALYSFEGQIWAFKKDAFALIFHTGDSRVTHRLVEQSNNIGCVNFKTVVEVGSYLFWLGQQDVYIGAGGAAREIGEPIRKYLNNINTAQIGKCFAWTDGLKYYLCLVTGSNTEPDTELVYDPRPDRRKWRVRSISLGGLRYGAYLNNVPYAGDYTGQTYRLNNGTTDNGTPISWSTTSRPFDDGAMEAEKELYELHIQGYFPPASTMTIEVAPSDRGDTEWFLINYDTSADIRAQNKNIIIPLDRVPLCNWYRNRISGTGPVELYQVQRYSRIQPVQN
ncbi:hypothetical protein JCM16163A_40880 [Paenibacillus sp. YK5]